MPEELTVSPLLDGFHLGTPVNDHFGVCCYPALRENSQRKYIVKVISVPASQTQLDALLITGAYQNSAEAAEYYRSLAEEIVAQSAQLEELSHQDGFLPYEGCQMEPMGKNRIGYQVYLLSGFRLSLERYMHRHTVSHLEAVNLGIDLCTALAACREAGLIYVDLKPSNIFISNKKEYKIGDLGFIPLSALKFTPMPEKYRSCYTAPELMDDLSVVNTTADTYSVGMILYQIFNGGSLPGDPTKPLAPPASADEEMAGILQKACHPDPASRWESPAQLRQALVDYMQRNSINNVPIMEPLSPESDSKEGKPAYQTARFPVSESTTSDQEAPTPADPPAEGLPPQAAEIPEPATGEQVPPAPQEPEPLPEAPVERAPADDTPPEEQPPEAESTEPEPEEPEEIPMEMIAESIVPVQEDEPFAPGDYTAMQPTAPEDPTEATADAAEPQPAQEEPPFSPEEIEAATVREFATLTGMEEDEELFSDTIGGEDLDKELAALNQLLRASEKPESRTRKTTPNVSPVVIKPPKKKRSAVGILFVIFLLCLLLAGGVWGYMYYTSEYLQTVSGITVQEDHGKLIVTLDSQVEEGLLNVVCTDAYGNSATKAVQNNQAEFTNITAGTFYTIQVEVTGLHKLTQPVSQVFTTQSVTNVVSLTAGTGSQDGSATLSMVVEGAEPDGWQVYYSAPGEPELMKSFTGHTVTVDDLVIGKLYTFRIEMISGAQHSEANGLNSVQFTPVQLIRATDLAVSSFSDGNLVLQWNNSATVAPESWIVHCSGEGYDETLEVTDTQAIFSGISSSKSYNVDVCAKGMTQYSRISISANPITLTELHIDESDPQSLNLSWQFQGSAPENGWQVVYTLDSSDLPSAANAEGTTANVAPRIPGAVYHFSIQTSDDTSVFNGTHLYTCPAASDYSGHGISRSTVSTRLLVTPEEADWNTRTVSSEQFTQSFAIGQPISVQLQNSYGVYLDDEVINILYVFRNAAGEVAPELIGEQTATWRQMWTSGDNSRCAGLDLPIAPTTAGNYVLDIYFNGAYAATADLSIY